MRHWTLVNVFVIFFWYRLAGSVEMGRIVGIDGAGRSGRGSLTLTESKLELDGHGFQAESGTDTVPKQELPGRLAVVLVMSQSSLWPTTDKHYRNYVPTG